tara:strand:+ start:17921 stop:18388 length:468 start_codon:yes stop_codon:yes gene_type:complete
MAHLTFHSRVVISVMQRDGKKQKEIAEAIEVSPSTVSRELARNHVTGNHYHPLHAERRANFLKTRPSVISKLEDPELFEVVSEKIALNWSPEQISGYLWKQAGKHQISHQTILQVSLVFGSKPPNSQSDAAEWASQSQAKAGIHSQTGCRPCVSS